jgi:hypothetical protein
MSDVTKTLPPQFSRRLTLRSFVSIAGGAVMLGTTMSADRAVAAPTKNAQKTVGYQGTPQGTARCDGCTQFEAPSSCKTVEGSISPTGWCRIYIKKPA